MKNRMKKERKKKNETDNRFLTLAFVLIQVGDIIDLAGEGKMKTESAKKTFFSIKTREFENILKSLLFK